jgi:hypothetical protein
MMRHYEMTEGVREELDRRGIEYEATGGEDSSCVTVWSHNGLLIAYGAYEDGDRVYGRISVSSAFTADKRAVDSETFARVLEALS